MRNLSGNYLVSNIMTLGYVKLLLTLKVNVSLMVAIGLLQVSLSHASPTPIPFKAKYEISKGVMSIGTSTRTLKKLENGNYQFASTTKPGGMAKLFTSGKVKESSVWKWEDGNIIPIVYRYKNSSNSKREVTVDFNWETMEVTNTVNGKPWKMDIESGTLDKLVYQIMLMLDLQLGKTEISYPVADGGKLKTYSIEIKGDRKVELEIGTFNTVKVVYKRNNRTTTMWCAKELFYFPVKIEQQKKDDSAVTAELTSLSGITIPESAKPKAEEK